MVYQRRFQTKQKGIARVTTKKLVVFKVGQEQYAIPLERVVIHSPQGGELFYLNLDSLAEKS